MSSDLTPNIPLLRKAVEWVEAEAAKPFADREWYQGDWVAIPRSTLGGIVKHGLFNHETNHVEEVSCGTAYCVAGYVGQLLEPQFRSGSRAMIDGRETHVSEYARRALGITQREADLLFNGGNTAEQVRTFAEKIAGERL